MLGTLLLVLVAWFAVYLFAHIVTGPHHHQFDLKIYFHAVTFWTGGHDLYSYAQPDPVNGSLGFTYPPLAAVLMAPMTTLGFGAVAAVSIVAIVASTLWCVWICLRERMRITRENALRVVGLAGAGVFLLEPLRLTLGFGQINIYLMVLVLLDVLVLARRGSRWTGVGIGLAMAIKITPGIFLLYFLLSKQWRAAAVAVGTAAVATLVGAVAAPAETLRFFTSLLWASGRVGNIGGSANQSMNGLIARLMEPAPPSTALWLLLVIAVGALGVIRIRRAIAAGDTLAAITLTGLLGILISPVSWPHHIVWVIPAAVIVGDRLVRTSAEAPEIPGRSVAAEIRARLRQGAGLIVLVVLGTLAFGLDLRARLNLPDADYTDQPLIAALVVSTAMFWCLAAMFLLPISGDVASHGSPSLRGLLQRGRDAVAPRSGSRPRS